MTAWKMNPELQLLNLNAAYAISEYEAARRLAREADAKAMDSEELTEDERYARSALSDFWADASAAAQAALDAILPHLNDDERDVLAARMRMSEFNGIKQSSPQYAIVQWEFLQDNDQFFKVPASERAGYIFSDASFAFVPVYTGNDLDYCVFRTRTADEMVGRGADAAMDEILGPITLRDAREKAGYSVSALARATGLTRPYVSRLDNGHASLQDANAQTVRALADTLGVAMERLVPRKKRS